MNKYIRKVLTVGGVSLLLVGCIDSTTPKQEEEAPKPIEYKTALYNPAITPNNKESILKVSRLSQKKTLEYLNKRNKDGMLFDSAKITTVEYNHIVIDITSNFSYISKLDESEQNKSVTRIYNELYSLLSQEIKNEYGKDTFLYLKVVLNDSQNQPKATKKTN